MPRPKEELRQEWEWMIDNNITLEARRKELNSKYKILDFNDIVEVTAKQEGRERDEELFKELEQFSKDNPDIMQEIQDGKTRRLEEREKKLQEEIDAEMHAKFPTLYPDPEEVKRKEEAEAEHKKEIDAELERLLAESERFAQGIYYTDEELKQKEEQKRQKDSEKLIDDIFDNANDEIFAEDLEKYKHERRLFITELNKKDRTAIHNLALIKRSYRKDLDLLSLTDEELAEAEKVYDDLFGDMPGDQEFNFTRFMFSPMDVSKPIVSVAKCVDDFIDEQSKEKTKEEIEALEAKSVQYKKALLLHSMAEPFFLLKFNDGEWNQSIERVDPVGEQLTYYLDYMNNGDKPPVQKKEEPKKEGAVNNQSANEQINQNDNQEIIFDNMMHIEEDDYEVQLDIVDDNEQKEVNANNEQKEVNVNQVKPEANADQVKPEVKYNQDNKEAEKEIEASPIQIAEDTNTITKMWQNLKTYQSVKETLAFKLASIDVRLQMTKYDNKGYEKQYNALVRSVKNALSTFVHKDKTPNDLKKALQKCMVAAKNYKSEGMFGFFEAPEGTTDIADEILDTFADDIFMVGVAERNLESDYLQTKGIKENDIEGLYKNFAEAKNVNLNNVDVSKGVIEGKKSCMMACAKYEKNILKAINKQYKIDVNFKNYDKQECLLPLKKKATSYDLAVDYVASKYIYKTINADTTKPESITKLNNILKDVKDGVLKQEIKTLSADKIFQAVVKKNPDDYIIKWRNVEENTEKIKADSLSYLRTFKSPNKVTDYDISYEIENHHGGKNNPDAMKDFVSTYLTKRILADDKADNIRKAVAAGMMDPEDIRNDIAKRLDKTGAFNVVSDGKNHEFLNDKVRENINNGTYLRDIMNSVVKKAKPKTPEKTNVKKNEIKKK